MSTRIKINIGRQQKQVIDVYVHVLKDPSSNRSSPKRLFERLYHMDLFWEFYGVHKNLDLNFSQSSFSLNKTVFWSTNPVDMVPCGFIVTGE